MGRKQDYITEARYLTRQLWDAVNGLKSMQLEWNSLNYGEKDGEQNPIGLGDGVGENEGYTQDEVGASVFATTDAILTLMSQGHGTNLASLL